MKFSKLTHRGMLAATIALVGIGLFASPATAEERTPDPADITAVTGVTTFRVNDLAAPNGVNDTTWNVAIDNAEATFGSGDKAYLEALKSVSLLGATYCDSYENITRPGAWYKVPRTGNTLNCVLEAGNNSSAVTVLQQTLNRCYGRGLVEDGAFGNATYNALMYAQSVEGIGVDGVYGPTTRAYLKWWGGGSICTHGYSLGI
ncbi:MAG: peptidoglycan-binding protein [Microbacterium sp.]|jgi:hypothetical protein|uniref:peptidoglycan-binding domain-containing protein n=1 Tax=Microbacterium sp. TaxID=51671 RepID=UPI00282A1CAE|nr:peptidoglycan-binding domain-containing protein [Microbacterium sp.]MDR2320019.1 peptidoglycan-binding protein [Microbacterium sp.]